MRDRKTKRVKTSVGSVAARTSKNRQTSSYAYHKSKGIYPYDKGGNIRKRSIQNPYARSGSKVPNLTHTDCPVVSVVPPMAAPQPVVIDRGTPVAVTKFLYCT